MSRPTIKSLTEQLRKANFEVKKLTYINEKQKEVIENESVKLNMANATVAELMEQVKDLQTNSFNLYTEKEKLKSDYALLEDNYNFQSQQLNNFVDKQNKITAENYALKAEIERTNRHINLAENQLHKEQQPLVVNHYHNCVINK